MTNEAQKPVPTRLDKHSATEMLIVFSNGQQFAIPFAELRFQCPCAGCVDEHTGQRVIQRSSIKPDIRPVEVQLVGRYAVQIVWNDRHNTGMYHYDQLWKLCKESGLRLS